MIIFNNETLKYEISSYTGYEIIVDDWKNCKYVKEQLDNIGIEADIKYMIDTIEDYEEISKYVNITKKLSITISIIIAILAYRNILKSEKENIKLLKIIGYNKNKINSIKISLVALITLIGIIFGCIIGYIILFILEGML